MIMDEHYDRSFEYIHRQISVYSPQAAAKLQAALPVLGAQGAYYAAFIIVRTQAGVDSHVFKEVPELTESQLHGFTFFEYVEGNPEAIALFADIFRTYQVEQQARPVQRDG